MAISLAASALLLWTVTTTGEAVYHVGGWVTDNIPFGITLVGDQLAAFMVLMAQLVLTLGFVYALGCNDQVTTYPTFYPVFPHVDRWTGGAFLTGDLFNLFVFAELLVVSGTILTAIADDRFGTEAAFKIFLHELAGGCLFAAGLRCCISATVR